VVEAVVVRELRKVYGDVRAVDGVSFTVRRGDAFALVGPRGAGKTTTMEILEGRRSRSGGEVSVLGVDPATGRRAYRGRIGIVPQEFATDERSSPRELLRRRAGAAVHPRPVDEVIALVGLEAQRDDRVETLPTGQRRRVDLALALVDDPELIFLDEPTTAFDPAARRQLGILIADLCAVGKTVMLTTNRVAEARHLADRVGVVAAGKMIAVGTPAELAGLSRSGRGTIRFRLPEHVAGCDLPDAGHHLTIGLDRIVELRSATPIHDLQWLTRWAADREVSLDDLTLVPPSFEDTYLELVGETARTPVVHPGRAT
jgi:ABC-2 type transport system ATP-binding protein